MSASPNSVICTHHLCGFCHFLHFHLKCVIGIFFPQKDNIEYLMLTFISKIKLSDCEDFFLIKSHLNLQQVLGI